MSKRPAKMRIGETLLEDGLLSSKQLTSALAQQKATGQMLGELLVEAGVISSTVLVQALAKGPASLLSGGLQGIFLAVGASPGQAYGAVFALEATGLLLAILLLRRVGVRRFQHEVGYSWKLAAENLD